MAWIYCKTGDTLKDIGSYICKSNFSHRNIYAKSKIVKDELEKDCWLIKTESRSQTSAMVYRIEDEIVAIEIDDDCAVNVIEPLMKKYGFANVKWMIRS